MELFSETGDFKLYKGSMLDMLQVLNPCTIDAIVTDPPYELGFMGKGWDNSGIAFQADTWHKCYQVLKHGGYLLAFGGSRTFHRIACAIEDAGFEIRDTIMWLYGSGFPKSLNLGLAIDKKNGIESPVVATGKSGAADTHTRCMGSVSQITGEDFFGGEYEIRQAQNEYAGWGTALKPAYEPIIVARKPCEGSCVDNVMRYGVGGLNIDGCRVPTTDTWQRKAQTTPCEEGYTIGRRSSMFRDKTEGEMDENGRYPANVILTYDESDRSEVCGGMPETKSNGGKASMPEMSGGEMGVCNFQTIGAKRIETDYVCPMDEGSAARYYYCAKASKRDRDEGLEAFSTQKTGDLQGGRQEGSADSMMLNADGTLRVNPYAGGGAPKKNTHPTVKPTDLMQYLVRLVTPKGGTVLDPFNGSGSTGKAVMYENRDRNSGYKYIGIELTAEYLPIADARIRYAAGDSNPVEYDEAEKPAEGQITFFDLLGGIT